MMFNYNRRYYLKREGDRRHLNTAIAITEVCQREGLDTRSFLDIGCASGSLLDAIRKIVANPTLCGIDHGDVPKNRFINGAVFVDLDLDLVNGDSVKSNEILASGFDVVTSIEVVEHVNQKNEKGLVEMFASTSKGLVFLSAARPRQRGYGHVNCASREHWIELFAQAGLPFRKMATEDFCTIMEALGAGDKENLMVFGKGKRE